MTDDTREGTHNEVWLRGDKIEIVGAYISENGKQAPGASAFLKECQKQGLRVRVIKELEDKVKM